MFAQQRYRRDIRRTFRQADETSDAPFGRRCRCRKSPSKSSAPPRHTCSRHSPPFRHDIPSTFPALSSQHFPPLSVSFLALPCSLSSAGGEAAHSDLSRHLARTFSALFRHLIPTFSAVFQNISCPRAFAVKVVPKRRPVFPFSGL